MTLFALVSTGWAINSLVKGTVEKEITKDLAASVVSIQRMIDTTINVSIRNYLRGISKKNVDVLDKLQRDLISGKMNLLEAKQLAEKILLSQIIGKTGYIYVLTSDGIVVVHPNEGMKNKNVSEFEFVKKQISEKKGYIEYNWQNPGEKNERPKVLYMAYFEPWDWIVSVSSYREEFISLFDIQDIQSDILSFQFGKSGSSFIMDGEGNFLVHQQLKGNISRLMDSESWASFFAEIKRVGTGTIKMKWMEKQWEKPRERLFFFHHISSLDWFVVSSVYSDEIRQQLNKIHQIILFAIIIILIIILPLSLYVGKTILRPLVKLSQEMEKATSGGLNIRAEENASGEIGRLAAHFNAYMDKLK
ncbi:MAG: cache domain-containing protein, partial [Desulfobacula sp.]